MLWYSDHLQALNLLYLKLKVYVHATTQLSVNGFSLNFMFGYFSKTCQENSSFVKIGQEKGYCI